MINPSKLMMIIARATSKRSGSKVAKRAGGAKKSTKTKTIKKKADAGALGAIQSPKKVTPKRPSKKSGGKKAVEKRRNKKSGKRVPKRK